MGEGFFVFTVFHVKKEGIFGEKSAKIGVLGPLGRAQGAPGGGPGGPRGGPGGPGARGGPRPLPGKSCTNGLKSGL